MTERAAILLVDDREENLIALEAVLEPLGHLLVRADSGVAALREILLHDFACILLDVDMPGIDGFETARMIKQRVRS
ncbi:MAG TPA: response regulator, partial [Gaiellaceae bacterium]